MCKTCAAIARNDFRNNMNSRETQPKRLATETVQGAALALEGVDDIERGDRLALGVLGVGDGVTDDTLEEGLEDTASLLVDHCAPTLAGDRGRGRPRAGGRVGAATYWPRYA
jgi:hypothetical protein